MKIKDIRAYLPIFLGGDVGLGRAYALGHIEINDVPAFLEMKLKEGNIKKGIFKKLLGKIFKIVRKNTVNQAKKNISAHYDLGNDFYKEWLDSSMSYSSGLFFDETATLEEAQNNKYMNIIRKLNLSEQNVLEIGCGWGGFIECLMLNTECSLDAITISEEQYRYCLDKIKKNNWEHRVKLSCIDYRDIPLDKKYDCIVSIEMVEALGYEYWDEYFNKIKSLLKKGGLCAIQAITLDLNKYDKYVNGTDFIRTYIFPGGCLVQLSYLKNNSILKFIDRLDFTPSYVKTLRCWEQNIQIKMPLLLKSYTPFFLKIWLFYLYFSIATFKCNKTQVGQFFFINE